MLCDPTWCLVRVQLYGTAERARNGRGKEIGQYRGRGETRGYVARQNTAISLIFLLLLIFLHLRTFRPAAEMITQNMLVMSGKLTPRQAYRSA